MFTKKSLSGGVEPPPSAPGLQASPPPLLPSSQEQRAEADSVSGAAGKQERPPALRPCFSLSWAPAHPLGPPH